MCEKETVALYDKQPFFSFKSGIDEIFDREKLIH